MLIFVLKYLIRTFLIYYGLDYAIVANIETQRSIYNFNDNQHMLCPQFKLS
jgi:hypothetical protein